MSSNGTSVNLSELNVSQIDDETVNLESPAKGYLACKRVFDVIFSTAGLLLLAPIGVFVAALIKATDRGSVFYRQTRIGLNGQPFQILKFRSMTVGAEKMGPSVTQQHDPRITRIGRILRRTKLDELPQLWNVFVGEMSFVGPRPEVPGYVDLYTPEQRGILRLKPGITDLATLIFRDEEVLLRNATNVEEFYVTHCIPRKLRLNRQYAKRANLLEDFLIILETVCPRWLGIACGYAAILAISVWLSYQLRFDFRVPPVEQVNMRQLALLIVPLQILFLVWHRQFVGLLGYFDVAEMKQLVAALGQAAVVQFVIWFVLQGHLMPARSIIVIDAALAFILLGGARALLRSLRATRSSKLKRATTTPEALRLGVIGAGELGAWLARQINLLGNKEREIVAFFDDDANKWNKRLCQVPVVGMPECILDGSWPSRLDAVILAVPGASKERQKQILEILGTANIRAHSMPSIDDVLAK